MKKSLLVLSALLALSMAFVGCKGGASDPDISDPAGDVDSGLTLIQPSDEWGNYLADLFADFADDDVLVVKYTVEGGTVGEGCVIIKDKGRTTDGPMGTVQNEGENTMEVKFSEVKALLEIEDAKYGGCGLVVDMWGAAKSKALYLKK